MIAQTNRKRNNTAKKTTVYNKFKGVDFSVDPSLVDSYRSPYAPNLISDIGGMPEKRLGWRTLHELTYTDENENVHPMNINGVFYGDINSEKIMFAHAKDTIYRFTDTEIEAIYSGCADSRSSGFFMDDKFYILTGNEYLVYDGETVSNVSNDAYVPTVLISRNPTGGGTVYESVNLLTGQKKVSFLGDTTLVYQLPQTGIESVDTVEALDSSGNTVTLSAPADYSVDLTTGKVTFKVAHEPPISGQDNVFITYTKTTDGYLERVTKCTISTLYGVGGSNRVFISGNPDYKAYDWYSDLWRPNYFPDMGYSIVGDDNTAIMGYQKLGKYLIIVKEDNNQDSTVFQRWGELSSDGEVYFPIEQGISGTGAASKYCFNTLVDEPLFLSRQGIMATTTTNILAERTIKNRSFYIDYALTSESGLENACSAVWNGLYILAVNNKAFILDSRNKSYRGNQSYASGDYIYECYHWTNIPARCFLSLGEELYFGTIDGRICKFNTDISLMSRFNDDDSPVVAIWSTKNDDDNSSYLLKTMQKKGTTVTIKPYLRSSAKIYYSKDGEAENFIRSHLMDILDFNDIDFERFTFNTNDSPQDVYLKKKVKKYKRLQIIIKNDGLSEGFGIFQIAKTYTIGNYAKK